MVVVVGCGCGCGCGCGVVVVVQTVEKARRVIQGRTCEAAKHLRSLTPGRLAALYLCTGHQKIYPTSITV